MNSASLAGCSILICEDEPLIALGIADAFTNAGARVLTVTSLARALIAIEAEIPSAVILDHVLSDGERSQICKRLKERNVPYVIHSGYSHLSGAYGDAVHVPKPANPDVLVTTVLALLQRRRRRLCCRRCARTQCHLMRQAMRQLMQHAMRHVGHHAVRPSMDRLASRRMSMR
ncbi:MAG: response regulator [Hyphomicrobiaceae bacterium]|nr:MAG: response regulator [Hyphomicrobiaceae bacterium]